MHIFTFISHVWEKLLDWGQYPVAWLTALGLFIVEAVSGGQMIINIVVIASVIDLVCGIAVAIKRKKFAQSELMRQTVEKIVVYGLALLVFLCIDKVVEAETSFSIDVTAGIVGVIITVTETWSFLASLLILFPNNPFLKMIQKALVGEIARKLGCEESEVKDILDKSRRKPKRDKQGRFIAKKK